MTARRAVVVAIAVTAAASFLVGCGDDEAKTGSAAAGECRPPRPERVGAAPLDVENLIEPGPRSTMDTDGDGQDDSVAVEGGVVTLTRSDGVVRLAEAGHDVALQAWADLDGDGRDDLVLADTELASGTAAVYLVPGVIGRGPERAGQSGEPGSHAPRTAGVRVDDQVSYPWLQDLDGRPGADLVVPVREAAGSHTDVYGGAGLLGLGPGADGRGTAPVRRLEGLTRGVAPLTPGGDPETLLLDPSPRPAVRFASRPEAVLEAPFEPSHRAEDIVVFDEDGVRKVGLQIDGRVAVWPVPGPCGLRPR